MTRLYLCVSLTNIRKMRSPRDHAIYRNKSGLAHPESLWLVFGRGVLRRTHIRAHPRLFIASATGILLYWLLAGWSGPISGFLIAFDGGALTFLTAVWFMMAQATEDDVRRRAELEDEGKYTVLSFGAAAAVAVLLAIVFELNATKAVQSPAPHISLAAATILLSWFFMNTIFACITLTATMVMLTLPMNTSPSAGSTSPASSNPTTGISCILPSASA